METNVKELVGAYINPSWVNIVLASSATVGLVALIRTFSSCFSMKKDCSGGPANEIEELRAEVLKLAVENRSLRESSTVRTPYKISDRLAPQALDPNAEDLCQKLLKSNVYRLVLDERLVASVFVLFDDYCIIPAHYARFFLNYYETHTRDDFKMVSENGRIISISKDILQNLVVIDSNMDVAMFRLPRSNGLHGSDARKFFITEAQLKTVNAVTIKILFDRAFGYTRTVGIKKINPLISKTSTPWQVPVAMAYDADSQKGDCGAPVIALCPTLGHNKILGFHIAGDETGRGLSNILTQEFISASIVKYESQSLTSIDVQDLGFQFLRTADKPIPLATKSKIIPSLLVSSLPPTTQKPAPLRDFTTEDGVVIAPMYNAVAKYAPTQKPSFPKEVQQCVQAYISDISKVSRNINQYPRRLLSFEESVCGLPNEPYMEPIPRNTSCGYPFIIDPKYCKGGKKAFFGDGEVYDFTSDACVELKRIVDELIEACANDTEVEIIFVDFLKDEKRPIEKSRLGKSRLISCSPLHFTIAFRMYFLCYMNYMIDNRVDNGSAIGINVYSKEWSRLYRYMTQFGTGLKIAGDFEGYDTKLDKDDMNSCIDIPLWFYGKCNNRETRIRQNLWRKFTSSIHINGDIVYFWPGGLPSGAPPTSRIGTDYNNVKARQVFQLLGKPHGYSVTDFSKYVYFIAFGDDNMWSISPEIKDWFNGKEIQKAYAKFGLIYTDAHKSADMPLFESIDDVTFLKRCFRINAQVDDIVAPLDIRSISEMVLWTKRGPEAVSITKTNIDSSLKELSIHGKSVYDEYAPAIISAAYDTFGYHSPFSTYELALDAVYLL
jgi:hypothetical protein